MPKLKSRKPLRSKSKSERKNSADQSPPLTPLDVNQRYTVDEAARYLRISRATLYNEISAGLIVSIKDRGRYIPGSEIARKSAAPRAA